MAITWGRSNVGGGSTVGASTGGTGGYSRTVSNSGGNVLGANSQVSAPTPVRRASTPVAQTQQPMQSQQQDYSAGIDMGGVPDTDSIYAPMEAYLGQVEQQLRGDLPTYQKEAEANYATNKSMLDTSKSKTMGDISTQATAGQRKYEDASTAARRLFNEQQMGMNQRFGGSSSAGEAGRAIVGQEQQRQMGSNQRSNIDFQSQIAKQSQQVEQEYGTNLLALESQKQQALTQIQRDFTSKLMEIANNRAQIGSAKAQARVQALMDYRNKVFSVQMQNMQFKQSLDAQLAQSQGSLQQANKGFGTAVTGAQGAYNSFAPTYGKAVSQTYNDNNATTSPYVGVMNYRNVGKGKEEEYTSGTGQTLFGRSMPNY